MEQHLPAAFQRCRAARPDQPESKRGHHPKGPEHWYLQYLGVEPRRQGKGLGGALLAPVLERCDGEGVPAHLETSTERNRARNDAG